MGAKISTQSPLFFILFSVYVINVNKKIVSRHLNKLKMEICPYQIHAWGSEGITASFQMGWGRLSLEVHDPKAIRLTACVFLISRVCYSSHRVGWDGIGWDEYHYRRISLIN